MKENYCVDNGAMIAYTGLLEYFHDNIFKYVCDDFFNV